MGWKLGGVGSFPRESLCVTTPGWQACRSPSEKTTARVAWADTALSASAQVDRRLSMHPAPAHQRDIRKKAVVRLALEAKSAGRSDAETFRYVREQIGLSPLMLLLWASCSNAIVKLAIEWEAQANDEEGLACVPVPSRRTWAQIRPASPRVRQDHPGRSKRC